MTSDPADATEFYTQVIGWSLTEWDGGEAEEGSGPYMMWTAGDQPIGGMMELPEQAQAQGVPPHWLAYVTVPDTESVVARTEALGGGILMEPVSMEDVGTFAVLHDPQGATFAVITPKDGPEGEVAPPSAGHFSWHELLTSDHEAAFSFYSELFGWERTESMDMGEMGTYQMYGPRGMEGFSYGGMMNKPAEMPGPPSWIYYMMVPEVEASVTKIRELGGQVLQGPIEVPGGDMIAYCMDPQGGVFAVHAKRVEE
jgi:predicted enzyme related to lactoylglutathione lyase